MLKVLLIAAFLVVGTEARRPVKEYTIDLDAPPETRYNELLPEFNSTVWGFYTKVRSFISFAGGLALTSTVVSFG